MLVLSRKANEKINIGDNVTIEIRRVAGNRVTLAIEAPRDVRILRGELEKIATEFDIEMEEPAASRAVQSETEADSSYQVSHHRISLASALAATPASAAG